MIMTGRLIYIASDHAGFEMKNKLKSFLESFGYKVKDVGAHEFISTDDYPDYAVKLCDEVLKTNAKGILICGSGQGMCIAANKIKGIRASLCWNELVAKQARQHVDSNVLCLAGRFLSFDDAKRITMTWLKTKFSNEDRHRRRISKISMIENER